MPSLGGIGLGEAARDCSPLPLSFPLPGRWGCRNLLPASGLETSRPSAPPPPPPHPPLQLVVPAPAPARDPLGFLPHNLTSSVPGGGVEKAKEEEKDGAGAWGERRWARWEDVRASRGAGNSLSALHICTLPASPSPGPPAAAAREPHSLQGAARGGLPSHVSIAPPPQRPGAQVGRAPLGNAYREGALC